MDGCMYVWLDSWVNNGMDGRMNGFVDQMIEGWTEILVGILELILRCRITKSIWKLANFKCRSKL